MKMKKFKVELTLSKIQPKTILCYSENHKAPDNYGKEQVHSQIPKKIIIRYIDSGVIINDAENNELIHLMHTDIYVECVCSHCGETNLYPDHIFLKESMEILVDIDLLEVK